MNIAKGKIGNALTSTAADHVVAVAEDVYDEGAGKYQNEINDKVLDQNTGNDKLKQRLDQHDSMINISVTPGSSVTVTTSLENPGSDTSIPTTKAVVDALNEQDANVQNVQNELQKTNQEVSQLALKLQKNNIQVFDSIKDAKWEQGGYSSIVNFANPIPSTSDKRIRIEIEVRDKKKIHLSTSVSYPITYALFDDEGNLVKGNMSWSTASIDVSAEIRYIRLCLKHVVDGADVNITPEDVATSGVNCLITNEYSYDKKHIGSYDSINSIGGFIDINNNYKFNGTAPDMYNGVVIAREYLPENLIIKKREDKVARYAFLKDPFLNNNVVPRFCTGHEQVYQMDADRGIFDIPDDCKFVYLYKTSGGNLVLPYLYTSTEYKNLLDIESLKASVTTIDGQIKTAQYSIELIKKSGVLLSNDESEFTQGFVIKSNGKIEGSVTNYISSPYIIVLGVNKINIPILQLSSNAVAGLAFYDKNYKFIENSGYNEIGSIVALQKTIDVPTDAVYVRFSYFSASGTYAAKRLASWVVSDANYAPSQKSSEFTRLSILEYNIGMYSFGVSPYAMTEEQYQTYLLSYRKFLSTEKTDIAFITEAAEYMDINKQHKAEDVLYKKLYKYNGRRSAGNVMPTIFSKYSISDVKDGVFSAKEGDLRGYVKGYITIDGKKIFVMCCHLWYVANEEGATIRRQQMQEIINMIAKEQYAIICGDFNANSASEYDIFKDAGLNLANCDFFGNNPTYPYTGPLTPLDNIITTPNIVIESFDVLKGYADKLTSDHLPIKSNVLIY